MSNSCLHVVFYELEGKNINWTIEGFYFTNSFLRGWSIEEGGHFARGMALRANLDYLACLYKQSSAFGLSAIYPCFFLYFWTLNSDLQYSTIKLWINMTLIKIYCSTQKYLRDSTTRMLYCISHLCNVVQIKTTLLQKCKNSLKCNKYHNFGMRLQFVTTSNISPFVISVLFFRPFFANNGVFSNNRHPTTIS